MIMAAKNKQGPDVKFAGHEEARMADWLEGVLKRYAATVISRKSRKRIEYWDGDIKRFPLHITSLSYSSRHVHKDVSEWGLESSNHTISDIAITYCFSQSGVDCPQHLLTKASRVFCNDKEGEDLDAKTKFRQHEINFYTKVIPGLEDWTYFNDFHLQLPLPYCYFGSYECTKIEKTDQRTKDYFISIGIKYKGYEEDMKNLHPNGYSSKYDPTDGFVYEMNTILLLEELTKMGYEKSSQLYLSFEEVEAAAKRMAQFHAVTYAWEVTHKRNTIKNKWPIFPKSKDFAETFSELILKSFSVFLMLFKTSSNDRASSTVEERLEKLLNRIPKKIAKLIQPAQYPLPNGIIHNDLCPGNIFFLRKSSASEDQTTSLTDTVGSKVPCGPEDKLSFKDENLNISALKISEESGKEDDIKDCRFIGWNLSYFGSVLHDVACLIFTSLPTEIRRSSTVPIIQSYYASFRDVCEELGIELPFDCQMLYNEFPNSLLYAALMATRTFEENITNIDGDYLDKFSKVFEELVQLKYI